MILHANRNDKKAAVAIIISEKVDFKTKYVTKGKQSHFIMIKGSIQKEDIIFINIYVPNISHKYINQIFTDIKERK